MASSEQVKRHPQLAQILGALLDGQACSEIAQQFDLQLESLQAYAQEAGLGPADPAGKPLEDSCSREQAALEGHLSMTTTSRQESIGPEGPPSLGVPRQDGQAHQDQGVQVEGNQGQDQQELHVRQVLEQGARRRGDPESRHSASEAFREEEGLRQDELMRTLRAEQDSYRSQPMPAIGARLNNDPLGQPGFELHIGFQPESRHLALIRREQQEREARLVDWLRNPFHWRQPVPPELLR